MKSNDRLLKLTEEKKACMEKFLKLTRDQKEAIKNREYNNIFGILSEKQSIMERVNLIDLELKNFNIEAEKSVSQILKEIKEIVADSIKLDEENINLLKANKGKIVEDLKTARKNKKTHYIYRGKGVSIEGVLLDKKK